MLDYFDAFLVGLTAMPDAHTYALFNQNVVSEYTHEMAVAGGVNVKGEYEVPKTLVFAKTDSYADDIIQIIREKFGESSAFCKKVTYKNEEDLKSVLQQFRNEYHPRIAVTVGMIATGTDVKPLECLLFMRDVKFRGYFEQVKGRGIRPLDHDGLRKASPAAKTAKTRDVTVDAIGVTESLKTVSRPPITKTSVPFKDFATEVVMVATDADTISGACSHRRVPQGCPWTGNVAGFL